MAKKGGRKKGAKESSSKKGSKKSSGKKASISQKEWERVRKDVGHAKALLVRAINHNRAAHGKKQLSSEKAWALSPEKALSWKRTSTKQLGSG